jgi:YbbR domain-containing protein
LRRLLRNWQLKVLALFIAVVTWSVVAYAGNPPSSEAFSKITIEHGQPPAQLVLVKEPASVTITVRGLQSSLSNFRRENLHPVVDLSAGHKGTNLLPIKVRVDSPDQSVVFGAVDPVNAVVVLDSLAVVQKSVDVRPVGTPNSCCSRGALTASPDTVTLTGPEQEVRTAVAFVNVDVGGLGASIQKTASVQVEGSPGPGQKPVLLPTSTVTSLPHDVTVSIEITSVKQNKPAGINPVTTGQLGAGFYIADIQVSPTVIQVEADPGVLPNIHSIDTDPINIAGATSDIFATVSLRPSPGVVVLTKGPFTVHFVIKPNPKVQASPSPSPAPTPT